MKILLLSAILIFISCKKDVPKDLELIVENDTIYNSSIPKKSINVIRFYVRNNSDKIYYINNLCNGSPQCKMKVYSNGINISIFDKNEQELEYNYSHFKMDQCGPEHVIEMAMLEEKSLGYRWKYKYFVGRYGIQNFFIHPKETVHLEYSVDLSRPVGYEAVRFGLMDLNKDEKYSAKISIASDSSEYKADLPNDILKTIKANNATIYHGIIESEKIPIKILE